MTNNKKTDEIGRASEMYAHKLRNSPRNRRWKG